MTEWLTLQQAAKLAQVSRRTLYNWIRDDQVVTCHTAGGQRRIDAASLFVPIAPKAPDDEPPDG